MIRTIVVAVVLAAGTGQAARALELADGLLDCWISNMMLGSIRIEDGTFAGPAFDGAFEESYPYTLDSTAEGTVVHWGGPLGGISQAGIIAASTLTDAGGGQIGVDITIENENGSFQTISCSPQ